MGILMSTTTFSSIEAFNKLMRSRCLLLTKTPWYGTMCGLMDWELDDAISTAGVRIKRNGRVECIFSPRFIHALFPEKCICAPDISEENVCTFCAGHKIDTIIGVLMHEVDHVVKLHCARRGSRRPRLWNYAADKNVNGKERDKNIPSLIDIPILNEDNLHIGYSPIIYLDPTLDSNMTTEEIYKWQIDNEEKIELNGSLVDNHDIWSESAIDIDQARQIVADMCDQVSSVTGDTPGHLEDSISKLRQPTVDWRFIVKNYVGRKAGGRRSSYMRRSKRFDVFGWPGITLRNRAPATVSVDVSASVSNDLLEKFFSEIESLSSMIQITLVQFDKVIQHVSEYHRGDWKNITIHGRGGTNFINLFAGLRENKLLNPINIIVTDGEAIFPQDNVDVLWVCNNRIKPPQGTTIYIPTA